MGSGCQPPLCAQPRCAKTPALRHSVGVVQAQDRRCDASLRGQGADDAQLQREVVCPPVTTGVEEANQLPGLRVEGTHVRPFVTIAPLPAGQAARPGASAVCLNIAGELRLQHDHDVLNSLQFVQLPLLRPPQQPSVVERQ